MMTTSPFYWFRTGSRRAAWTLIALTGLTAATTTLLQGCAGAVVAGGAAAGASLAADPRSSGTILDDQAIEFRIANAIQSDKELAEQANIAVTCYNGVVLLTGEAPTTTLRDRAYGFAKNDGKVRQVYNEVTVEPPLPLKARNYDSWITTKVKTKLLSTEELNAVAIKVTTSGQNVYLMGLVKRKEADMATKIVANIEGVNRVVRAFEYLD